MAEYCLKYLHRFDRNYDSILQYAIVFCSLQQIQNIFKIDSESWELLKRSCQELLDRNKNYEELYSVNFTFIICGNEDEIYVTEQEEQEEQEEYDPYWYICPISLEKTYTSLKYFLDNAVLGDDLTNAFEKIILNNKNSIKTAITTEKSFNACSVKSLNLFHK